MKRAESEGTERRERERERVERKGTSKWRQGVLFGTSCCVGCEAGCAAEFYLGGLEVGWPEGGSSPLTIRSSRSRFLTIGLSSAVHTEIGTDDAAVLAVAQKDDRHAQWPCKHNAIDSRAL